MEQWKNVFCACIQYFARLLRPRRLRPEVFPIRVIDVRATLSSSNGGIRFVAPTDWSFHVISHTWSMEILDFSKQIGEQIVKGPTGLYDHCLERADLRGKPAYKDLIEFLQLLAEDGVTHIWLDTLCINQTDDKEKSKEIGHMGAYYSRSKGCYALVHGVGQGYAFWLPESNPGILPRWFNRVWTIQEFVLPRSLMVVTELPASVQKIANGLLIKANSSAGFCRCCIFKDVVEDSRHVRSPLEFLPSSVIDDNCPTLDDGNNFCGQSTSACSECHTSSLVKRAQRTISGRSIYMVEREAYLFLLFLGNLSILQEAIWPELLNTAPQIAELMRSLERPWDPWMVLAEVARRECTYDEDRVLGILGLLGLGGEMQLRTRQSLEQQLVHVAKFCDPGLLMKICAVDPRGGATLGMSWAPNFRDASAYLGARGCNIHPGAVSLYFGHHLHQRCCGHLEPGRDTLQQPLDMAQVETSMDNLDARINRFSDFKPQVKVVNVTNCGIMLEGKAAVGRVMPHERLGSKDREAVKAMLAALSSPRSEQESPAHSEEPEEFQLWREAGGVIESPRDHTPTHCIQFQDVGIILPLIVNLRWNENPVSVPREPYFPELVMAYVVHPWNPIFLPLRSNQGALKALQLTRQRLEDRKIWINMELWAVLLGTVGNENYNVAMVCVGLKGNTRKDVVELHKVGIFVLPVQIGDGMFGSNCQCLPKYYKVGGFGHDLSEFVTVSATTE